MTNKPPARVIATLPFIKALKRLKKKYPHVDDDLKPLIKVLEQGNTPGDQIPGIGYPVYKERLRNSDAQRGQRGGYRVIYYVRTSEALFLIYIYTKTEMAILEVEAIRRIIEEIES